MPSLRLILPAVLEILRAVDQNLDNLMDQASQDTLLQGLITRRNSGRITDAAMVGMISKLHSNIQSSLADHSKPKQGGSGKSNPGKTDFWASGTRVFQDDWLESVGYKDATYENRSENDHDEYQGAQSTQAVSVVGSASSDARRDGDEIPEQVKKRQSFEKVPAAENHGTMPFSGEEIQVGITAKVPSKEGTEGKEGTHKRTDGGQQPNTPPQVYDLTGSSHPEGVAHSVDSAEPVDDADQTADAQHPKSKIPVVVKDRAADFNAQNRSEKSQALGPRLSPAPVKAKIKLVHKKKRKADDDGDDDDGSDSDFIPKANRGKASTTGFSNVVSVKKAAEKANKSQPAGPTKKARTSREDREPILQPEVSGSQGSSNQEKKEKQYALDAGARADAKYLPTRQPANPSEIARRCDGPYVDGEMESIKNDLFQATRSLLQANKIDRKATPKFVPYPEAELETLYQIQWGSDWQTGVSELAARKPPVVLLQEYHFMSLLGADLHTSVFKTGFPWDVQAEMGGTFEYFEQVFRDIGHEPTYIVQLVKGRQIADPKFQEREVVVYAQKLVGALQLKLMAHLRQTVKLKKIIPKSEREEYDPWQVYLNRAYKTAIILKQNLMASKLGPFTTFWPKQQGGDINGKLHSPFPDLQGTKRANAKFVHGILPGVQKKGTDKESYFSRALVHAK